MLKLAKKELTGLKTENQILLRSISFLERDVQSASSNISTYKSSLSSFQLDKLNKVKELKDLIDTKRLLIDDTKLPSLKTKIDSFTETLKSKKKYLDYSKDASVLKSTIEVDNKKILKDLGFFENTKECSICQSVLTEEHRSKHLDVLGAKLNENNSKLSELSTKESKLNLKLEKFESIEQELRKLTNEYTRLEYTNKSIQDEIKNLERRILEEESKEVNFNIPLLEKQLEDKLIELKQNKEANESVEKSIKINQSICEILSDKGIKSYFFNNLLPILNSKINYYLDLFELPVRLEFNNLMEETLKHSTKDEEYSYNAFSEGEKKRIDLAILLSFIDTTKAISNWDCNVIFFDELLDNAVDSDGLEKILESLKNLCYNNREQCIYVITHKLEDFDSFDRHIRIKKESGFSSIEVLNK